MILHVSKSEGLPEVGKVYHDKSIYSTAVNPAGQWHNDVSLRVMREATYEEYVAEVTARRALHKVEMKPTSDDLFFEVSID